MKCDTSRYLFSEAKKFIPGGVNSPVRAFQGVGGSPIFIRRAQGAYLIDEDGNRYIDLINSWGPMILGHAHPAVVSAVSRAIEDSASFGTPTRKELEIAQLIIENIGHIEQIRFVNSGTEACMSAVRLARGFTKRDYIVKLRGCYHGHADSFLVSAGSGAQTLNQPDSAGVPEEFVGKTLLADFNNLPSIEKLLVKYPGQIAGVILEPVVGNMGCLEPAPGFLTGLQDLCKNEGTLLILDEVMTGFRLAFGGAAEIYGLDPDLVCYGKIIGGGMPVGAFGGRANIMSQLAPEGPVYQAGTLSGNPISVAAGLSTLQTILHDREIYSRISDLTTTLAIGLRQVFEEKKITAQINQVGSMMSVFFCEKFPSDYQSAKKTDTKLYARFFHHMLENGIYLPPSNFESWFISDALEQKDINYIVDSASELIRPFQ